MVYIHLTKVSLSLLPFAILKILLDLRIYLCSPYNAHFNAIGASLGSGSGWKCCITPQGIKYTAGNIFDTLTDV